MNVIAAMTAGMLPSMGHLDSHASTPSSPEITCSLALLMVGLTHICTGVCHT
jgi:hypothetical protein